MEHSTTDGSVVWVRADKYDDCVRQLNFYRGHFDLLAKSCKRVDRELAAWKEECRALRADNEKLRAELQRSLRRWNFGLSDRKG